MKTEEKECSDCHHNSKQYAGNYKSSYCRICTNKSCWETKRTYQEDFPRHHV